MIALLLALWLVVGAMAGASIAASQPEVFRQAAPLIRPSPAPLHLCLGGNCPGGKLIQP